MKVKRVLLLNRLAALLILITLSIGLVSAVVVPYNNRYQALVSDVAEQNEILARYKSLQRSRPEIEDALRRFNAAKSVDDRLLTAGSAALAAAELQTQLTDVVAVGGGRVRSAQILSVNEEAHLERISVRTQLDVTLPQLTAILRLIERERPKLMIGAVSVDVDRRQLSRVEADRSVEARLAVSLDVYGFRRDRGT